MATMTALRKEDGRSGNCEWRGNRRLVAKCLARQFDREVEAACSWIHFVLSTRTRTDCVGHVIRALADAPLIAWERTTMCITVPRSKLLEIQKTQLRFAHTESTSHACEDEDFVRHHIRQSERRELGDSPMLLSLGCPQLSGSKGPSTAHVGSKRTVPKPVRPAALFEARQRRAQIPTARPPKRASCACG